MPRKKEGDTQKRVHLWLFEADWDELKLMYSDGIGPSKFVRFVVRRALNQVRENANKGRKPLDVTAINAEFADIDDTDGTG